MMFQLTHPLPTKYYVACSGGVDSMAALHWSSISNKVLGAIYIHHNTGAFADQSEQVVKEYCYTHSIPFMPYRIVGECPKGRSREDWWREQRYAIFDAIPGSEPIVLAHHLDDCIEEYLMCTLVRGWRGTIPYARGRCIRPFRKWRRADIVNYATRHKLKWAEDPSNSDTTYKRNYIRHEIVPKVKSLNPGIYKIVEKIIE